MTIALCRFRFVATALVAVLLGMSPRSSDSADVSPQKLVANDGASSYKFGCSVDISGANAVVASCRSADSIGSEYDSGSVYLYRKDAFGNWEGQGKLARSDAPIINSFGNSVAISGNTIVVGAVGDEAAGMDAGAAYIFQDNGQGSWSQVAKLFAEDAPIWTGFGRSVDIDGDTAVVGAEGRAYVFSRTENGPWFQTAELSNDEATWLFGQSVAIDENTIVVGDGSLPGFAYVYRPDALGAWHQIAKMGVNDPDGAFGYSVAISGNRVIIGGKTGRETIRNRRNAVAYIFHEDETGTWSNDFRFSVDAPIDELADKMVSISDNFAIVGFPKDDLGYSTPYQPNDLLDYGSVYAFARVGESWSSLSNLQRPPLSPQQYFGVAVALDGESLVVGAYGDNGNVADSGAAYLYELVPEPNQYSLLAISTMCLIHGRWRNWRC